MMTLRKVCYLSSTCILLITTACSNESVAPVEPVAQPKVQINSTLDDNGVLNKVEANAFIVKGTTTLGNGQIITATISDTKTFVGGTAVVDQGQWSTEFISVSGLENGEIKVTAEGTDQTGLFSNMAEFSLYLDQEPPNISITGPIAGDDIIDSEESAKVLVQGTSSAADGQEVLVTFGDKTTKHLSGVAKLSDGKWEIEMDLSSLTSGSLMLMAEVSDLAGNPSTVQRSGVKRD